MSTRKLSTERAEIEADDLVTEILLRLPSRLIYRFKSTCKQWHSLIATPEFRKLWRSRSINREAGFILQYRSNGDLLKLFFPSNKFNTIQLESTIKVVQSCNGLLLCKKGNMYSVYNIVKNLSSNLPELPKLDGETYHSMTLAFDPYKSPYYQVIYCSYFYGLCDNFWLQIHIYSSGTTPCWTLIFKKIVGSYFREGVYWKGSIHWIFELLYFHIESQTLKAMPTPHHSWNTNRYFGESCGRLNYTTVSMFSPWIIHIYELKRDYSEWVLKYYVNSQTFCSYKTCPTVLSVVHGEEEDDSFLVLRIGLDIVRYNFVSMTFEVLHHLTPGINYVRAIPYIESLCCV